MREASGQKRILLALLTVCLISLYYITLAQISISVLPKATYRQDFDSLGTNDVSWKDNFAVPGWYFVQSINGNDGGSISQLVASDGSVTSVPTHNLGNNADRALGSKALKTTDVIELFYGARFVNDSDSTVTNVTIIYAGEQWADLNVNLQTINFFYRIGGSNFLADPRSEGWTAAPDLNFVSPQNFSAGTLDGNETTNRVEISGTLPVIIPPREEFWIQWADTTDTEDHILGIDDVEIVFDLSASIANEPILGGVSLELKYPKIDKKLKFPTAKGFKVQGFLHSESNVISRVAYVAFAGTNTPTNLIFIDAGKFKTLTKGKLFEKKKVKNIFQSTKITKIGAGITNFPITLLIKVIGGNNTGEVIFTNTFTDGKIER